MSDLAPDGDFTRVWVKTEIKNEPPDSETSMFYNEDNFEENVLGDSDPMVYIPQVAEIEIKEEPQDSPTDVKDEEPETQKAQEQDEKPKRRKKGNSLDRKLKKFSKAKRKKCPHCPYQTANSSHMLGHKKKHSGKKDLSCLYCDYKTKYANSLKTHERNLHGNGDPNFVKVRKTHPKRFKCTVEDCTYKAASRQALKTHMNKHSEEKSYKCEICDFTTKFPNALKRHKKSQHKNTEDVEEKPKEFKCESCNYRTSIRDDYHSHVKTHYDDYFICNMCDYETVIENMFKIHMKQHDVEKNYVDVNETKDNIVEGDIKVDQKIKTESTPPSPTQTLLQPKRETKMASTPKPKQQKCPHCDYKSSYRHHFKTHLRKHSNEKDFKCSVCDYETKYPTALRRHLKTQHLGDKEVKRRRPSEKVSSTKKRIRPTSNRILKCPQCDYTSKWNNALQIHIRKHSDVKPFLCDQCDYSTYYNTSLRRHLLLNHSSCDPSSDNHKPHICEICGYRSLFKVNLKNHMRKHSVDKQFRCEHCGYATSYRNCFEKHLRMHDRKDRKIGYQCEKCPFYTRFEGKITLHMVKIHKQELKNGHRCPYCEFSTTVKWRLNIHIQRSRQKEPINCKYCEFKTLYKCEGKTHKSNHFPHSIPDEYIVAKIEKGVREFAPNDFEVTDKEVINPEPSIEVLANEAQTIIHQNLNSKMLQNFVPAHSKHNVETIVEIDQNKAVRRKKINLFETNDIENQLDISTINWDKIPVLKTSDNEKPFGCYNCSYTARFKAAVQRHFQRHHGGKARPYKCNFCDFAGSTKDSLGTHSKKSKLDHFKSCSECDFSTTYKCQFVAHQKIHYKYRCAICTYSCKQKATLDSHYLLHQGSALKCKMCDYVTVKRASLMYHMMSHTGVRPLQCRFCNYSSGRRELLHNHMRRFHNDELNNIAQPSVIVENTENIEKPQNGEDNKIEIESQSENHISDDSDHDYESAKTEENVPEHVPTNQSEPYENYASKFDNEYQKMVHQNFEHYLPTYAAVVEDDQPNEQQESQATVTPAPIYEIPIVESNILNWERIPVRINKNNPERPFECYNCSYASKFRGGIRKHFQRHHGNKARPYKCPHCDFAGSTKDSIGKHRNRGILDTPKSCEECDFSTIYQCEYVMHKKIHYTYRCTMCTYSCMLKKTLENHYLIHEGALLKCSFCSFETKSKYYLKCHETQHREGKRRYECDHCDYATHTRSLITVHLKKLHNGNEGNTTADNVAKIKAPPVEDTGLKPFKCEYCSYAASGKVWYRKHLRKFHLDDETAADNQSEPTEKPYKCHLCPFSASGKGWLVNHLKIIHNLHDYIVETQPEPVDKPLKCQHCSYATTGKSWLRNHMRKFHTNEPRMKRKPAEKNFKCPYCPYSSTGKGWLKNHIKVVHKIVEAPESTDIQPEYTDQPFKCQYCPYSTTAQSRLESHVQRFHGEDDATGSLTESPEKPFKCHYCNYSASGQAWLQNHIDKYHTPETQSGSTDKCFKCALCPYAASGRAWLDNHVKRAHTDDPDKRQKKDKYLDGEPRVPKKRGRPRKPKPNEHVVTVTTNDLQNQPIDVHTPHVPGNNFLYYTMM